jgi:hypothetical protein
MAYGSPHPLKSGLNIVLLPESGAVMKLWLSGSAGELSGAILFLFLAKMNLNLNPGLMATVRWSSGSCGVSGCKDPECVCALCAQPIGIPEDDPRRDIHDQLDCAGCELCDDDVPTILFRGEGKAMKQAAFHTKCFKRLLVEK